MLDQRDVERFLVLLGGIAKSLEKVTVEKKTVTMLAYREAMVREIAKPIFLQLVEQADIIPGFHERKEFDHEQARYYAAQAFQLASDFVDFQQSRE